MSVFCPGYVPAHLPPSFHPCGAQESSSWLGPWPLMLPVDEGCLQDASHAHREGNGTALASTKYQYESAIGLPMSPPT